MKSIRHLLYILIVTTLAVSCVEERMPAGVQPADVPCVLKPDRSEITFSEQGEARQLVIKSQNVSWELTGAPEWLTISQKSGNGDATLTLIAVENKDVDNNRAAVLQLKSTTSKYEFSKNLTVTQSAADVFLNTSETSLTLSPQAVQKEIPVSSNVEWEAISSASWLTVTKPTTTTLSLNASENTTAGTRTATITLRRVGTTRALATISVVQSEAGVTGSIEEVTFEVDGGTKSVDIEADVAWSATTSEASWLTVTPTSGTGGKASLGITALANNSTAARSGYVYVNIGTEQKLAIPVSQEGISFDVTGTLENFVADGSDEQKLTVESNTAWAVLSCPEWLTVTPTKGSKGTCEMTLQAAANNSLDSRSATLRIGIEGLTIYKDITVAQESVTIDLGDRSLDFGWETAEREVEITFPGSWSAMASDDWITLSQTGGLGEETIIVTAATNPGEDARTGTITVASEGRSMKITAVQQGQYLKINSTAGEVGAMGGSVNLTVTTTVGAAASVEYENDAKDWVTYDSDGKGNYTLSVAYNPSSNIRTAQFVIKPTMSGTNTTCSSGVKFAITQKGRSLSANVNSIAISVAGGTSGTYTITADSTYTITKPDADDWYTLQQDSASCTFSIVATENTTNNVRTSRLTVSLAGLPSGETKDLVIEVLQHDLYNGYEYVDLGLPSGIKWATFNVGATKPEEYGGYYAWGETEEKEDYEWNTYKWCNGSENSMTKYCTDSSYGTVDNKTVLDLEDDVAHVKWGGSWRMPTKAEQDELRNSCTWTWTTQNGVKGYKVTSKSNGNSIFLPAAGYRHGTVLSRSGSFGCYWSSSLDGSNSNDALYLYFSDHYGWYSDSRYYGHLVRPVCGEWQKYTVSVGTAGSGAVAIKDVDGTSATVEVGSTVAVVATPDEGYLFDGWYVDGNETPVSTAAEYTFTVSEDVALVAKFTKCPVVTISSGGNGSVSFADSSNGSKVVLPGTEVAVVATPDEGYLFDGWYANGNGNETPVSTSAEYSFTVSEDVALEAKFVPIVYEAVDLGLPSGIKWATFNVGATAPEEYGGYYAWGETEEKENYSWSTYKWCNGSETTITKYCTDSSYGTVDNKTDLDLEDDVAHVKWGGDWRMPTLDELKELKNNCTWTWTTQNGVYGYRVTGSNGNSIFLPATGSRSGGDYWSSSLNVSRSDYACHLSFNSGNYVWSSYGRYDGHSVRPVCGEWQKYTVSVGTAGSGAVAIKDVDGTSAAIEVGSTVTVVATPAEGYMFSGWYVDGNETPVSTAAEYTFTVSEDVALEAKFTKCPVVTISSGGNGSVSFADSSNGSKVVLPGTEVAVVATPDEGYLFDGWYANGNETPVSTAAEYTFTVSEDVALEAKFVPIVYEAVDLGLPSGIKWATCNVGATKPEEYGGYYAWGEIEEKEFCTKENSVTNGKAINDISGNPMYDVACAKWGSKWRMPTKKEYEELLDKCTWIPDYINGVHGYIVEGVNGNSIFMPTAGYQDGGNISYGGLYGYYWSSTPIDNEKSYACVLDFQSSGTFYDWYARELGKTVRPVCGELRKYTVSVSSTGNGNVAIKDKDGTSAVIEWGSTVTVVATPNYGYALEGWYVDGNETPVSTSAEYSFTVSEDVALEAKFTKCPVVTISSGGNGSVSFADSSNGSKVVLPGAEVTVVATPDGGYAFDGWYANGNEPPVSTSAEYSFTVSEDVALEAKFVPIVYEAVDLGLPSGIKWATHNVGATKPEEYGGYYAWGETEEKEFCTKENSVTNGKAINDISGNPMYDVACAKWGSKWRMPTKKEYEELLDKCTWIPDYINGVHGYIVEGVNGNSIFMPTAGYQGGGNIFYGGSYGYYWSSTPIDNEKSYACVLDFQSSGTFYDWYARELGKTVRPVCGESSVEPEPDDDSSASDYYVVHGADVNVTHSVHYPKSVGIVGTHTPQQSLDNIATAPGCAAYFDKSSTVFEVKSGELVEPRISINGTWMHGYVFVDWDNSKQFEVNLEGNGPYTKGEGNELMSWSCYDKNNDDPSGWNSSGTFIENSYLAINPGEFRVPAGLKDGSTYRMRFAIQWNSIDPSGSYANFISDGGSIIDVTLKINGAVDEVGGNESESINNLSQLDNNTIVTLTSERAFLMYSPVSEIKGQIYSNTGKLVGDVTQNPNDVNQQFRIVKSGNNYYLYSMGAGKYVDRNGNYTVTVTDSDSLTLENVGGEYPWKLMIGGNGMNCQWPDVVDAGIKVDSWTYTDPGNCYMILVVDAGSE